MTTKKKFGQIVLWGTGCTTLFVTPTFSFDPMTVSRFFVLITFGGMSFCLILATRNKFFIFSHRKVLIAVLFFFTWTLITLFMSKINLTEGLFGISGRHTGVLSYLAFLSLMVSAMYASSKVFLKQFQLLLILTGVASGFYGCLQSFGVDPFEWANPYSPVFGFFGNPNFQASFMGIAGVGCLGLILAKNTKRKYKFIFTLFIFLFLYNIIKSESQQGYIVFLVGLLVISCLYLIKNYKYSKFSVVLLIGAFLAVLSLLVDILQLSPWKSILYKDSVSLRGDYWRAGIRISLDHPIFGVGLDGYRDNYKQYRDFTAATRPNAGSITDSAHNIFLDISSGGGFPLLLTYLILIIFTFHSALKVFRRTPQFDVLFSSVFAGWVAYLAQSFISISQLGLAIWGWIFMGAIIGYEVDGRDEIVVKEIKIEKTASAIFAGLIFGIGFGMPLVISDANFRSSIKQGDVFRIEATVRNWPQSTTKLIYVARLFREANLNDRSVIIAREAVRFNPHNLEAWQELYRQPKVTVSEQKVALQAMKKLDPFNPNLK